MSARYTGGIVTKNPQPLNPAAGNAANGVFTMDQYMQAVQNGTWPAYDPYFENTTLLLHGNGTNGAQNNTFLDSSTNNFTITRNGNTTQGSFSPFSKPDGRWGNYFDGTGDWIQVADNAAFTLGSGDFTIECWVFNVGTSVSFRTIAGQIDSAGAGASASFLLRVNSTDKVQAEVWSGGTQYNATSTASLTKNTWNHVAFVRDGNTTRVYINGNQEGTANVTGVTVTDSSQVVSIGRPGAFNGDYWNGYVSNFRLVKGTCLYPSGTTFTPPTTPLTNITNTQLLTCQSNRFVDNSSNNFTITRNGDVKVTPFSPFPITTAYDPAVNGGSGYFDGTGDYLVTPSSSNLAFGTGDFCVEFWIYKQNTNLAGIYSNSAGSAGGDAQFEIQINSSSKVLLVGWSTTFMTSSASLGANTWTHVAVVRSGTSMAIFMNGSREATATSSNNFSSTNTFYIGAQRDSAFSPLLGYLSNLRAVKGSSIYDPSQTTITVPTAPLTAVSNTSLLTNFTNAGIFDNTGFNNLETVGNAQIDTAVKKFGSGALEFDGSGDVLKAPDTTWMNFVTPNQDWTIECWIYPTSTARMDFICKGAGGSYVPFMLSALGSGSNYQYNFNVSNNGFQHAILLYSSNNAYTLNQWNHVAVTKYGTTVTIWSNGINVGSASGYSGGAMTNTLALGIGGGSDAANPLTGYLDDVRFTVGIARYTANFAVPYLPTQPLPLNGGSYAPYTTLMLPGTGTNGAQNNTFLDSSTNNFTITRNGNTTQGTFSPFSRENGYWGNFFDGNGDILRLGQVASGGPLDLSTATFTAEAWVYLTATPSTSDVITSANSSVGTNSDVDWTLRLNSNGTISFVAVTGGTVSLVTSTATVPLNSWVHVAIVRSGTTGYACVNGTVVSGTVPATLNSNRYIAISGMGGGFYVSGYISNVRVLKGTALYTSNFTPPTAPLTAITNTSLLTCQSNRFVDNSTNNFTITANGNVAVSAFSPFGYLNQYSPTVNGGSGYFDGSGDYLNFTDSSNALDLGGTQASIDMWVYPVATGTQVILMKYGGTGDWNSTNGIEYQIQFVSGVFNFAYNNGGGAGGVTTITDGVSRPTSQWYHICIATDASNNIGLFINGTRVATGTNAITKPTTRTTMFIGKDASTNATNGYLSSVNFISGANAYSPTSTTIAIPSIPSASISGTQLLTNFTNAGIYDASMSNDLETVGNAQISTSVSKFGGGSMYFDGNGDYLKIPNDQKENLNLGSGNFTIEFWAWKSANGVSGFDTVIGVASTGNANGGWFVELSSSRGLLMAWDANVRIQSNFNPNDSTWHHYAVVRNGSTFALYKDGAQLTTATLTPTLGITGTAEIASLAGGQAPFNGYISNLRILKGVALLPTALQTSQWQDQ